jgi:Holliday junction resolvase
MVWSGRLLNEKQFENKVKKFLKDNGIWYFKVWGGGYSKAGIPDLICCVNGHFVAIELKGSDGKPSELQKYNIRKISECNGIGVILYPEQFETFKLLILDLLGR